MVLSQHRRRHSSSMVLSPLPLRWLFLALAGLSLVSGATQYALDTACEMPVSLGGKGFCGPAQCVNAKTNVAGCVLTNKPIDYAAAVAKYTCKSCTQVSTASQPCACQLLTIVIIPTSFQLNFAPLLRVAKVPKAHDPGSSRMKHAIYARGRWGNPGTTPVPSSYCAWPSCRPVLSGQAATGSASKDMTPSLRAQVHTG